MFLGIEVVGFQAIAAAFLMNIYIVGLNQLSDIDIDKVGHALIHFFFRSMNELSDMEIDKVRHV